MQRKVLWLGILEILGYPQLMLLPVKRFYFSDTFSDFIFMENKDGKTTAFAGLTRL